MHDLFQQPAIFAAFIAALAALLTVAVNATLNAKLHRERVRADLALVQKRFEYDRALAAWRRRYEFAEPCLRDFYEARAQLSRIRSAFSLASEIESRPGRDEESEGQRYARDAFFPVAQRLTAATELFNGLYSRRYLAIALLGAEAEAPFATMWSALMQLQTAIRHLSLLAQSRGETEEAFAARERNYGIIWEGFGEPDAISLQINQAVTLAETLFRPVLSSPP